MAGSVGGTPRPPEASHGGTFVPMPQLPTMGGGGGGSDSGGGPLVPMPQLPTMGGGKGGGMPAMPRPTQGQFAQVAPQGGFNVNQAAAGALQQAMQGTQQGLGFEAGPTKVFGYNPAMQKVQGRQRAYGYNPANYRAYTLSEADIGQYQNPFTEQVIDRTRQDIERQQAGSLNTLGSQAETAGAFGGGRHGLAEGAMMGEYGRTFGDIAAQQRQAGYDQALQAAQFDIGQRTAAQSANAAARTAARQYRAGARTAAEAANIERAQQVAAANAAARTAARQYRAGARTTAQQQRFANQLAAEQQRMGAASQLAGLGQQAFQTGQTIQQQQAQQGLLQQGLQQALIDAARGQYAGYIGSPSAALQAPLAALGVTPVPQSTTTSRQPGLFDYLTLAATGASRMCWVAREVYGEDDPKWLQFREWVIGASPDWFYKLYSTHGEKIAEKVKRNPWTKKVLRPLMDIARKSLGYK